MDRLVHVEKLDPQVPLVRRDELEVQVQEDCPDQRVRGEKEGNLAHKDQLDLLEKMDHPDLQERLGYQVLLDPLDQLDKGEMQDHLDHLGSVEKLALQADQEKGENLVHRDSPAQ